MLSNMALGLCYQRLVEFGLTAIVIEEIGSSQLTRRILGGVIRLVIGRRQALRKSQFGPYGSKYMLLGGSNH